jgi:hypothetical protein
MNDSELTGDITDNFAKFSDLEYADDDLDDEED